MTKRVTDEQARRIAVQTQESIQTQRAWLTDDAESDAAFLFNVQDLAADLLDARAEIATLCAKLAAVCEAGSATQKAFEEQAECGDCDAKAEAMGGRVDPLCDVCMERWAVSTDALDDAIAAAREGK